MSSTDWSEFMQIRELWEVKQQREEFARDVVRKDTQMKEMQQRLESGEGCKLIRTRSALDPQPVPNPILFLNFYFYQFIRSIPKES